jgi:chromate transporter
MSAISLREATVVWARIGLLSFGGPAGQIALMHRILVEEKRWASEGRFLHALNYCMLLPGPEAMQLATYIGWLLHGVRGGLVAGILFVVPGFIAMLALSILYALYRDFGVVSGLFFGLKAAVLAVVLEAVIRIGRRTLRGPVQVCIAAAAFVAIFFLELPFPFIVFAAGVAGLVGSRYRPSSFGLPEQQLDGDDAIANAALRPAASIWRSAIQTLAIWLPIWFTPILLVWLTLGADHVLMREGVFFSKAAVVTFGGAYAVLAYIAQQAVDVYQWLQPAEMLDGLGMAETTPGPLIMVTQFVGFIGALRFAEPLAPLTAAVLGSCITTWVTFVPCFLWIFLGAPHIERVRDNKSLGAALSCITAAVVGVILNLAIWFAVHTLFDDVADSRIGIVRLLIPDWQSWNGAATVIAAGAFVAMFRLHWSMLRTLVASVVLGLIMHHFFV